MFRVLVIYNFGRGAKINDVINGCPLPDNWRTLTEGGSALTSRAKVFGITSWLSLMYGNTGYGVSSPGIQNYLDFYLIMNLFKGNFSIL